MIITATDLHFSYGKGRGLVGLSATFGPGINGLLGPNGAGKTTLLRILASTIRPASGTICYDGVVGDPRSHIGFLPQHFEVLSHQSVRRNIEYASWTRGVTDADRDILVDRSLAVTGLGELAHRRAKSLSGGERQRLGIACATVHQPALVMLDEPTVGLDPEQRVAFRHLVDQLGRNSTVILSTHIVEDLVHLDSRIVVIDQGVLRYTGTLAEITNLGEEHPLQGMSALEAGYVHVRSFEPIGVSQ